MVPKGDAPVDPVFYGASSATDILIPIMGQTGAGKSFFINTLLGEQAVNTGFDLQSCTRFLEAVPVDPGHKLYGHFSSWPKGKRLVLVDTPGFDDTNMSDVDILERVAKWLAASCSQNMMLAGIIYLHDINQPQITSLASKSISILQKLCGKEALSSVVIGTTQWNLIKDADTLAMANERHKQLRKGFWNDMILAGSTVRPVKIDEPWSMIDAVYPCPGNAKVLLRIQHEMVDLRKTIGKTDAGVYLRGFLLKCLSGYSTSGLSAWDKKLIRTQLKKLNPTFLHRLLIAIGL